ncbi:SIR2 family protein [Streptomyces sp. NPDC087305]|uniref:SIR2 family protein n=1 Tax=Streptomyces sp. NPDC087305 TaxID=3365781 RepID=UPI003824520E
MKRTCYLCEHDTPVELPESLIDAAAKGNVVIFAGAGVSTEVPAVFPVNMYTEVVQELQIESGASFPTVMQIYEDRNGRPDLIRKIWQRFDYADSFPGLREDATRFHRELATMPYISEIITTNWDRYFEHECGAIPIVSGADYALHSLPNRKVYKIHGSIDAPSSIVATSNDYQEVLESLKGNAIGGTLRHLLATKTAVFIGYSLSDSDFVEIYTTLTAGMSNMRPRGYIVSPFPPANASDFDLTVLQTGGDHFLRHLKKAVSDRHEHYLLDDVYNRIKKARRVIAHEHMRVQELDHKKFPGVVYCLSYQDGLLDACNRILARRKTGEYSDGTRVHHLLHGYDEMNKSKKKEGNYWDASYIEGYMNGLTLLLLEDEEDTEHLPLFFCFSRRDLLDFNKAKKAIKNLRKRRPKKWQAAADISARIDADMVPQHTPFL